MQWVSDITVMNVFSVALVVYKKVSEYDQKIPHSQNLYFIGV